MLDGRFALVSIYAVVLWCLMIPSHRLGISGSQKIRVARLLAFLAGSKTDQVSSKALGWQLGFASIILWYTILVFFGNSYLRSNAFVFSILLGGLTGLVVSEIMRARMS